tara:strand:- start:4899 stop:6194 length:1296 start_codon:yes stop_codon:yes gene_type:complete
MSLLRNIIQGAYQGGKRLIPQRRFAPASLLDTATNPKTYQGLAQSASDTLGRALPPQFRGAGFQNVPAGALGALDDAAAAPFAGPVRQQILQKASKDFARRAGSGTTRVPVIPTGGQPVNFATPGRYTVTGGGIPRQAGGNLLGRGLQGLGRGLQGLGALRAANQLRQGNVGGAVLEGSLMAPLPYLAGAAGLFALGDGAMTSSVADGTRKDIKLTPQQQALADKLTKERIAAGSQKATVGNSGLMNLPPSVNTNLAAYDEGVTLPNVSSAGNAGSFRPVIQARNTGAGDNNSNDAPLPPPPTDLPASAEETPAMMDPYAYNLAVYGQGRTAAGTQEERKAVQNLGTAINQRLFPKLNNQTSFNPLMARTFPDRYPQSLEAFIEERGIQKPNSMTEADSATALADATNAVEPMLTPEVAEQLRLLRQQGRL